MSDTDAWLRLPPIYVDSQDPDDMPDFANPRLPVDENGFYAANVDEGIDDLLDPPDDWTPSDAEREALMCELNPDYFALED